MSEENIELTEEQKKKEEPTTEQKENVQPTKKQKLVRNVWVKQCIGTIIFGIVVCLLTLIPYTFGNAGLNFTFKFLPLIGNGEITHTPLIVTDGLSSLLGLDASIMDIIGMGLDYFIIIFYGIILFDILAALLLAIFRSNVLRIIFKVISIISAIAMILIAVLGIVYILGIVGSISSGAIQLDNMISVLETSGILFIFVMIIFAFFMSIKQFRWFARRW